MAEVVQRVVVAAVVAEEAGFAAKVAVVDNDHAAATVRAVVDNDRAAATVEEDDHAIAAGRIREDSGRRGSW